MKLCQKCMDAITRLVHPNIPSSAIFQPPKVTVAPESECEFWAHKCLNALWWQNRPTPEAIRFRCHNCDEIIEFKALQVMTYTCKSTGSLRVARADHRLKDGTYCDSEQRYRFEALW